jgi:hypothetical protein
VTQLRAEWERAPSVQTADALGWALHKAGADKEALAYARRATDPEHGGTVRSALIAYHRGEVERELGLDGPARRHIGEALRINPAFSPLLSPLAKEALSALGAPSTEGPPEKVREPKTNAAPPSRPHAAPRSPAPERPGSRRPAGESPAARPAAPVAPPKSAAPPATPPAATAPAKPSPRQAPQAPKSPGA